MQTKRPDRDPYRYVCAVFVVKNINPHDFMNFIKLYQPVIPFSKGYEIIKQMLSTLDEVDVVDNDKSLTIDLTCSITLKKIKTPVRGEFCTHLKCFELESYIIMNSTTNRRWICPCNPKDKPVRLFRDEFMMRILERSMADE
jgi:hypothetical protein